MSRALLPWIELGAAVDNGVGSIKACIANFLILVSIIAHDKVHGFVSHIKEIKQLAVAFADRLLIFLDGGTAFAFAHVEHRIEGNQTPFPECVPCDKDVLLVPV